MNDLLYNEARISPASAPCLLLAHGAGVGSESPFMQRLAESLAGAGINVWRFEFPYMQKRRVDGRKRPPDRQSVLLTHFAGMVEQCRSDLTPGQALVIGGKSMGGRMASLLAALPDGPDVQGVACFGYPFHPPGKPDQWRTEHFSQVRCPVAVLQGTRDPFGKPEELFHHGPLPGQVHLSWLEGGDHDLRPLKKQQLPEFALIDRAAAIAADFIHSIR